MNKNVLGGALISCVAVNAIAIDFDSSNGSTNTFSTTTNINELVIGRDKPNNLVYLENQNTAADAWHVDWSVDVGKNSRATNSLLSVQNGGKLIIGAAGTNNLPSSGILMGDTSGNGVMNIGYDSKVIADNLYIGAGSNETGNVSVKNDGLLEITENLIVGSTNSWNNSVNVSSGGELLISGTTNLVIRNEAGATENLNRVTVESGGSLLIKGDVNAQDFATKEGIEFDSGATLGVGGKLTTAKNAIEDGMTLLLDNNLSTNHIAEWNSSFVKIGESTAGNSLILENGAQITSGSYLLIGDDDAAANNNTLSANGSNSTIHITGTTYVGADGNNNKLEITDGASMTADGEIRIGASLKGEYNKVIVNGTGSVINAASNVYVGFDGNNNSMTVSDTAELTIAGELVVGDNSRGNTLTITDASVSAGPETIIGRNGDSNTLNISGTNAMLTSTLITIGENGDSNILKLNSGALVKTDALTVGALGGSNSIEVRGSNSVLNASGDVIIGQKGDTNKLKIYGGTVTAGNDVYVGKSGNQSNEILISGADANLNISNQLFVGSDDSSNNTVKVQSGGTLTVNIQDDIVIGAATNNMLTVADKGILKTLGWDFANSNSNIVFNRGSALHLSGTLSGTNKVEGGLNFVLDGPSANWDTGTNNLYVGYETANNSLILTNGATVSVSSDLFIGYESSGNTLTVAGFGTSLSVTNDLTLGAEVDQWQRNNLNVLEGAGIMVGNDVYVYRGSTLKIDSSSQVNVGNNYVQDQYSTLELSISSNQVNPNLVVEGDAKFASSYDDDDPIISILDDGIGESNVINIVKAGGLYLDDQEIQSGSFSGQIATNSLLGFTVNISNSFDYTYIVLDNFIKRSIGESGDLEGQLLDVSIEIEDLAAGDNTNATKMLKIIKQLSGEEINTAFETYYGEKQSSIPAHNVINMGIQSVANQLTMRADSTRSRMGTASAAVNFEKPKGAAGPHEAGQELQGWINGYGTWGSQDASDGFSGYDADVAGFMIGADFSVAENILMGIAGGKGNGSIKKNTGSSTDTDSVYAAVYGSTGTKDWFVDASFIYGISDVDTQMGTTFDTTSDFSAKNIAFYVGGGREIKTDYFIITPQLSMLANSYSQDAYTEEASNAVGREIDSFDAFYLQSSLGCSMGMYMGSEEFTFKPEIRAHWLHEWVGSDETINYNLINGTGTYQLALQAPEKDILKIGVGSVFKFGEYLELRADLDTRQSGSYSDYTLLGSLRYQF